LIIAFPSLGFRQISESGATGSENSLNGRTQTTRRTSEPSQLRFLAQITYNAIEMIQSQRYDISMDLHTSQQFEQRSFRKRVAGFLLVEGVDRAGQYVAGEGWKRPNLHTLGRTADTLLKSSSRESRYCEVCSIARSNAAPCVCEVHLGLNYENNTTSQHSLTLDPPSSSVLMGQCCDPSKFPRVKNKMAE
jgi:hypothetical protein